MSLPVAREVTFLSLKLAESLQWQVVNEGGQIFLGLSGPSQIPLDGHGYLQPSRETRQCLNVFGFSLSSQRAASKEVKDVLSASALASSYSS